MKTTAIWWIRRDLRLRDNPTLGAALKHGAVIPLFIQDPALLRATPLRRRNFLWAGLRRLDADLRARGSRLVVRAGPPESVLASLLRESGTAVIYAEEDYTPYARRRDDAIQRALSLRCVQGQVVRHPPDVLKGDGTPYTVFTPFSKRWLADLPALGARPAPERLPPVPEHIQPAVDALPTADESPHFPAGEAEAQARQARFIASGAIYRYAEQRNRLDLDGTSALSPYMRFGMLGARQVVGWAMQALAAAPDASARKSVQTWLNQLIWREFFTAILYHFPQVHERSFRSAYERICWLNNEANFADWQRGQTGYPVVDAAMRQLRQTGWMHNRARMIVASFLVKDLLIDWRWGEAWFMENLLDADIAQNNGGWQWTAGVGTDAAPYFRILNPVLQSKRFDPHGAYIRRWVPELAHLPDAVIHGPWEKNVTVDGYPRAIVDHKFARQRTLDAYAQARAGESSQTRRRK